MIYISLTKTKTDEQKNPTRAVCQSDIETDYAVEQLVQERLSK